MNQKYEVDSQHFMTLESFDKLPKYQNPPLIEVCCGVIFSPFLLKSTFPGIFANTLKNEFPKVTDAPLIASQPDEFLFSDLVPLRRVWFISEDDQRLIQLQENRFHFNWRKTDNESNSYPHFESVFLHFTRYLKTFLDIYSTETTSESKPSHIHFELSYVNLIESISLENMSISLDQLLLDHKYSDSENRFLKRPDNSFSKSVFQLNNNMGELTITAHKAREVITKQLVMRYELTIRGMIEERTDDLLKDAEQWFEQAHPIIVLAFQDTLNKEIQEKVWRKEK